MLTVAICTYNPRADLLQRALSSLRDQTIGVENWRLVLIDNASTNRVVHDCDMSWHPRSQIVLEEKLGLTFARCRAIEICDDDLILFIDDDNVLRPDYIDRLLQLAKNHPNIGVFGAGVIAPEFESVPSAELKPYLDWALTLRLSDKVLWSNDPRDQIIPWGAGMAVRRSVSERYRSAVFNSPARQELGRRGAELNSGEDDEFSWVACELGLGKGIFPELELIHLIPESRVQKRFLLGATEGHAYSRVILNWLHGLPTSMPASTPSAWQVVASILRASPSLFFHEGQRWWSSRNDGAMDIEFRSAARRGTLRGLQVIANLDRGTGGAAGALQHRALERAEAAAPAHPVPEEQ